MSVGSVDDVEFQVGEVRGYFEGELLYIEAPYGSSKADFREVLAWAWGQGYEPGPSEADEETEEGLRMPCHRNRKPHGHKVIANLLSTPLLLGMGALMASIEYWLQPVASVVIG